MKLLKLSIIVFSFIFAINSYSQDNKNIIKGKVVDQDSKVIAGVNVYIPYLHKGTISNDKGEFIIENVSNSNVKVQFSMIGYETLILNSSELLKEIVLHNSIIELEDVVVSGGFLNTADRSAVKSESISADQLSFHSAPS